MVFVSLSMDPSICRWVWISPSFGLPEKMTKNIVFKWDSYFFSLFLSNQTELFLFSFLYNSKISTEMLLFVWRFMEDWLELLSPYMVLSSLSPFCKFNLCEALIFQSSYFSSITQLYLSVYVNSGSYIMCDCSFCVCFWSKLIVFVMVCDVINY